MATSPMATATAAVKELFQGKPISLTKITFRGDPMLFKDLCKEWAATAGAWCGNGKMTAHPDDRMFTDRAYAFELYGDGGRNEPDARRPLPTARVWIEARSHPARPGEGAPNTSQLALEMKDGEWSRVEPQVTALLAFLRQGNWLDEGKK